MMHKARVLGAAFALLAASALPVVARAAPPLAPHFTPATAGSAAPDADGFIRRWLLLEPIAKPNRTNQLFTSTYVRAAFAADRPAGLGTGSGQALPRDGQTIAHKGASLTWHALDATPWDVKLFGFAQAYGKPTYGVIFWAVTVIDAPRDIPDAHLAAGSNSASVWWLNGAETAALFGDRRMVMDDVVSPAVGLKKGRNVLIGAVINGPGLSDFCVRFVDGKGQPIRDLAVRAQ
ncbi:MULTISPECIES: acetylxylan esterase [unclassified Novosphingobium]|uniref:acetylxylan esterase n=1 Tax=unclassified Novosphingobium TaxID=2644732 RepID=UPI000F5EFC9D|nr:MULTISPECIES: acetylxylan esterase [unclassified Novosphingobium]MBF5092574.1 acetylxylan esterase [Novosphingobium sp. NBM11]RQW44309.1 acetylxylan esterase [Novosphingobium sp. LASN5T]